MADLMYAINSLLEGYITDENGNFDWTEISDDAHSFFNDLQRSVGTFLFRPAQLLSKPTTPLASRGRPVVTFYD
ncbi:MAG TPA: hypothetical protein VGK83_09190 [Acidimicrobiia bacterium]